MAYFFKNDPVLLKFATIYIESIYPDLVMEDDPYQIIENFLSTEGSGINFSLEDGKLFLDLRPTDQDPIRREVTKELVTETLYMFEVSLGTFDVVEEFSDDKLKSLGSYTNDDADYTLSINKSSAELVHRFIKFKNREIIQKINDFEVPTE
jgi:hypothetical protein